MANEAVHKKEDQNQETNRDVSEAAAVMGHEGGQVSGGNFKNDPERAAEAGRKGGENSHRGDNIDRDENETERNRN